MEKSNLPVISQDTVKAQISIALTKQQISVQNMHDEASRLVFSPENIPEISAFLKKLNDADKIIEQTHKDGKAPYLEGGRTWDAGKNSSLLLTDEVRKLVKPKFDKLCQEEDRKKREADELKQKQAAILSGIESNVISFSAKIAACTTNEELLGVERLINLEKSESNAKKYGEFHKEAIEKYDSVLKPILKDQKEKIKQQEELKQQHNEAIANDDIEKIDEINGKLDAVTDEIIDNQVKVQEEAINKASLDFTPMAEEIIADTKFRRSYNIEIVDEKEAIKKAKDLIEITINKTAANVVLNTLKDTGAFKDKSEVIVNGIKYSEIKNYK